MKILAKDFKLRQDLEDYIKKEFGTSPPEGHTIEGTREDLAKLHLSEKTNLWGIPCISEEPQPKSTEDKPFRGKQTDFGINQKNNKAK